MKMTSAQEFLTEFTKALIAADPLSRQQLTNEYAKRLEAREKEIRLDEIEQARNGVHDAALKRTLGGAGRMLEGLDFDYYFYLRTCELNGEQPLPDYAAYIESQR
jgi:hypothetical protein